MFGRPSSLGVRFLLDTLVDLAPAPAARPDAAGVLREIDSPFSAFVSRSRLAWMSPTATVWAFVRICSGTFERGMIVTHSGTNRPFATKYASRSWVASAPASTGPFPRRRRPGQRQRPARG